MGAFSAHCIARCARCILHVPSACRMREVHGALCLDCTWHWTKCTIVVLCMDVPGYVPAAAQVALLQTYGGAAAIPTRPSPVTGLPPSRNMADCHTLRASMRPSTQSDAAGAAPPLAPAPARPVQPPWPAWLRGEVDALGDHALACTRTGLLARRAKTLERARVRVAREAVGADGQVVPQQWLAHTTAPTVRADDRRRLDLVIYTERLRLAGPSAATRRWSRRSRGRVCPSLAPRLMMELLCGSPSAASEQLTRSCSQAARSSSSC